MKGHLNATELEEYKKADLQELATKLGVSTEGTIKEIAARCAEVEVDIQEESELTEEEKVTEAAAEKEETAKTSNTAGKVAIKAIQDYKDLQLKRIVKAGERLEVDAERAAVLTGLKLVVTE